MSRSRKKWPLCTDYSVNYTPYAKRYASRKVRYYKGIIPDGRSFKKLYESWDIFDFKMDCFEPEYYRK